MKKISRRDCTMALLGAIVIFAGMWASQMFKNQQIPLASENSKVTISWLPATVRHWDDITNEMGQKYNIDPNLLAILITMESGGYTKAQSEVGAEGLMQIMPPTAKDIATRYLKKPVTKYDLKNPRTSIEFGAAYLAMLRDEFGAPAQGPSWNATVELLAAAYNGGPGAANSVEKGEGLRDVQTVVYSRDAFNMWRERHASTSPTFNRWKERGGNALIDKAKTEQAKN